MSSSPDMNFARNILNGIMSCNYSLITSPFMNPIEPNNSELKDYLKIIKEPVCLSQSK